MQFAFLLIDFKVKWTRRGEAIFKIPKLNTLQKYLLVLSFSFLNTRQTQLS